MFNIDYSKRFNTEEEYKFNLYKAYINVVFPEYIDNIKDFNKSNDFIKFVDNSFDYKLKAWFDTYSDYSFEKELVNLHNEYIEGITNYIKEYNNKSIEEKEDDYLESISVNGGISDVEMYQDSMNQEYNELKNSMEEKFAIAVDELNLGYYSLDCYDYLNYEIYNNFEQYKNIDNENFKKAIDDYKPLFFKDYKKRFPLATNEDMELVWNTNLKKMIYENNDFKKNNSNFDIKNLKDKCIVDNENNNLINKECVNEGRD